MKAAKVTFVCGNCGYESLRWLGKCPHCDSWDSFTEEKAEPKNQSRASAVSFTNKAVKLKDIQYSQSTRVFTGISEFDRVLGGGFMPGSIILLGGDPGIGKSTLVLQAAASMQVPVLYVSGEESATQIKLRAERLRVDSDSLLILAETDLQAILHAIEGNQPGLVIIDSIQTTYDGNLDNAPGSVTQLRECTTRLMEITKRSGFATVLIGHITKEGAIAGPKMLEHIVDTVIMFEGDSFNSFRILRAHKNRFGSTNEIGVFEMLDAGLKEVNNPSELFLSQRSGAASGSVITASIEGSRPILIEVQGLVTPSHFGTPQRVSNGLDYRRLSILLAVLEKRGGLKLSNTNVFVNITGGVRIDEPAIDLAVCCAVASNLTEKHVNPDMVILGEVGLGGEIRSISHMEKRLQEAEKIGFKSAVIPAKSIKNLSVKSGLKLLGVQSLGEALHKVLQEK